MFLAVDICSAELLRSTVARMLKVHQFYPLKVECSTAQGWAKVWVYIAPRENTEEGRERTGIIYLFSTENPLQTRSGSAVSVSNKNKHEQLGNGKKSIAEIMSGELP